MKRLPWMLIGGVLLVSGALLTYRPWIADPRISRLSGPVDSWAYFGASAYYLDAAIHRGEFPLWNPLVLCGTPYAANPQSKVFYPPHLLRSALVSEPTPARTHQSLRIYFVAHTLMAGLGTFLLARRHGMSPTAALVSAYVLVFSGQCVLRAIAFHFIDVFAWLPWELWLLNLALGAITLRLRLMYTIAAGLVAALSFLAGYPQVFLYCAMAVALYIFAGTLIGAVPTPAPPESSRGSRLKLAAMVLSCTGVIALLASMALILPAAEFYGLSARNGSQALVAEAQSQHRSWRAIAEIVFLFRGAAPFVPGLSCLSVVILGCAVWLRRDRGVAALLFVMIWAGLDLSLGPPFPLASMAGALSPIELPAPRRALVVSVLPLCLAAGLGVDALAAAGSATRARRFKIALLCLGGALAIGLAYALNRAPSVAWNPLAGNLDLQYTALFAPMATVMLVAAASRLRPNLTRILFLGVIVVELGLWNTAYVPLLIEGPAAVPVAVLHTPAAGIPPRNVRAVHQNPNINLYTLEAVVVGYEPGAVGEVWEALAPPGATGFTRQLMMPAATRDSVLGNLLLKRPFWLVPAWARGSLPRENPLFAPTQVAFITNGTPTAVREISSDQVVPTALSQHRRAITVLDWRQDPRGDIIRGTLPEFSGHSALFVRYESDGPGAMNSLFFERRSGSPRFGWASPFSATSGGGGLAEIPLPDSVRPEFEISAETHDTGGHARITGLELVSDLSDENDQIQILHWRANSVEVEVSDLLGPRLLVFTDADFPGWRVFVDGEPATLFRADAAFKAVSVAAGTHRVEFRFRSRWALIGAWISALAWIASLGALGVLALSGPRALWTRPTAAAGASDSESASSPRGDSA